MDLTEFGMSPAALSQAKSLAVKGLMTYQPFVFDETLECGVGYEFERDAHVGLVHYPDLDPELLRSPELDRIILGPGHLDEFRAANARLRKLYDHFADRLCEAVGDVGVSSFLDVGCNTGYFPQAFALRGAGWAGGCDRQDFSEAFDLLNGILGTDAQFINSHYDPMTHQLPNVDPVDAVISCAVLCHTSDPVFHLAALGKVSRKALLVWTIVNDDDRYSVHLGEPRTDYPEDKFPICFDNLVCPSMKLLQRSFELMGYREIVEVPVPGTGFMEPKWLGYQFRGLMGIR